MTRMISPPLDHDLSAWILSQRPDKTTIDVFEPNRYFLERECCASGRVVQSGTILLTNKECPWRCLMCDLWKHTLPATVPPGAIPAQIEIAVDRFGTQPEQLKLYNSGSFFDPAAIPMEDYPAIAEQVSFANHLVVESHPRLVGARALRLRDLLDGSLEVAMGLETVHPQVLPRLNKRFTLDHFAQAAGFLGGEGIAVRAFILVKPPFMNEAEAIEWAVESARFAFSCGVGAVSLIPTRPGNGAMDRLIASGDFVPPSLEVLEDSLDRCLDLHGGRVFADTWDLLKFSACDVCFKERKDRLESMNLTQRIVPRVRCPVHCAPEASLSK
jgi:radical SAM enzyme (TIGR01210 family)